MSNERISETLIYSVTFDCWGYSQAWIETIYKAIPYDGDTDTCDWHEMGIAGVEQIVFTSTEPKRVSKAKSIFARMANLAKRTDKGINHNRMYTSDGQPIP